jgi:hypothetical protein
MLGVANHAPPIDSLTHLGIVKHHSAKIFSTGYAQFNAGEEIVRVLSPKRSGIRANEGIADDFMANGKIPQGFKDDFVERISGLNSILVSREGNPGKLPFQDCKATQQLS